VGFRRGSSASIPLPGVHFGPSHPCDFRDDVAERAAPAFPHGERTRPNRVVRTAEQNHRQILERLSDAGIEFVIVGDYAALTHGSSFLTRDLDLRAILAPGTIHKLRGALADLNPKHRRRPQ